MATFPPTRIWIFVFLLVLINSVSADKRGLVRTSTGLIRGTINEHLGKLIYSFLGIPYAIPPLGDLRFRKPRPIKPWKGIYNASRLPSACAQYRAIPLPWIAFPPYSEDCLYLNIWSPLEDKQGKSVLVWIHGGGAYSGSSNLDEYDGSTLAAYGDVIVASLNYRVGVFGFLNANIREAPGNMGMLDQVVALRWIKNNIKAFGGDPEKITLFGQSLGAVSISLHQISPLSKGLFTRGILESGSAYDGIFHGESANVGLVKGDKLAFAVGCSNESMSLTSHPQEVVACLKNIDSLQLSKAESEFWMAGLVYFLPSYGDEFMPFNALTAIRKGHFRGVDIIIGSNSNEGSIFMNLLVPDVLSSSVQPALSLEEGANVIQSVFGRSVYPTSKEIADRYLRNITKNDHEEILRQVYKTFGDYFPLCPSVLYAEETAKKNNSVHFYYFDHVIPWRSWLGMTHAEEIQFVFGRPFTNTSIYTPREKSLSQLVMTAWTSFAKSGKPWLTDNIIWPRFTAKKRTYVELKGDGIGIKNNPHDEYCSFWERNFT